MSFPVRTRYFFTDYLPCGSELITSPYAKEKNSFPSPFPYDIPGAECERIVPLAGPERSGPVQ